MRPFDYDRAAGVDDALASAASAGSAYLAGGTTLLDLMKLGIANPERLVDITRLSLGAIDVAADGSLVLGALARMSDVADDATVRRTAPALAEALEQSASGQLRNMATLGGNVLQRTRCFYFRDLAAPCNKREPGSGCGALGGGDTEDHAVLGTSDRCIATHASDFAVVLVAFGASLRLRSASGTRVVPCAEFFTEPGETPDRETELRPGELIVAIEVPASAAVARSTYLKIRERTSYAFALASCAAGIELADDGTFADVRIALGGVATVPWRAAEAETVLRGERPSSELFAKAAAAAFERARTTQANAYKVDLGERAIVRALETLVARERGPAVPR